MGRLNFRQKTNKMKEKTTDEMLLEIISYKYKTNIFPYIFLDYSSYFKCWCIVWRNPLEFTNEETETKSKTPKEACEKALQFIKDNPKLFTK